MHGFKEAGERSGPLAIGSGSRDCRHDAPII
jgi:hypothetical protein